MEGEWSARKRTKANNVEGRQSSRILSERTFWMSTKAKKYSEIIIDREIDELRGVEMGMLEIKFKQIMEMKMRVGRVKIIREAETGLCETGR